MSIRKIFELLEHTLNRKVIAKQQIQHAETAYAVVSSPNFVDPAIVAESEEKRLENVNAVPGDSGLIY